MNNKKDDSILDILEYIRAIKQEYPQLRLCQILSIAASRGGWVLNDTFSCPDELIAIGLKDMWQSKVSGEKQF